MLVVVFKEMHPILEIWLTMESRSLKSKRLKKWHKWWIKQNQSLYYQSHLACTVKQTRYRVRFWHFHRSINNGSYFKKKKKKSTTELLYVEITTNPNFSHFKIQTRKLLSAEINASHEVRLANIETWNVYMNLIPSN